MRVLARCPKTNKPVDTGMRVESPPDAKKAGTIVVKCPHCGEQHIVRAHQLVYDTAE